MNEQLASHENVSIAVNKERQRRAYDTVHRGFGKQNTMRF
jgi:hypothetical protein